MIDNEPDRCIRLEIPNEGYFDITVDTAELWYNQLYHQLHKDGPEDVYDDS